VPQRKWPEIRCAYVRVLYISTLKVQKEPVQGLETPQGIDINRFLFSPFAAHGMLVVE
jgi:hypothetical protein